MAAFKAAVQSGMRPGEFWEMTPYLARHAVAALRDGKMSELWWMAELARQKKLPKLETLLIDKPKASIKSSEENLKAALKQMGRKHG